MYSLYPLQDPETTFILLLKGSLWIQITLYTIMQCLTSSDAGEINNRRLYMKELVRYSV